MNGIVKSTKRGKSGIIRMKFATTIKPDVYEFWRRRAFDLRMDMNEYLEDLITKDRLKVEKEKHENQS